MGVENRELKAAIREIDLPLEKEIFELVQKLYEVAETDSDCSTAAVLAEEASQILTLKSPDFPEETKLVGGVIRAFKAGYQVVLGQVLQTAVSPYRQERRLNGKTVDRPRCSQEDIRKALAELKGFGILLNLFETGALKFKSENVRPIQEVFARAKRKVALDSFTGSVCGQSDEEAGLPNYLRIVLWDQKIVGFQEFLSCPALHGFNHKGRKDDNLLNGSNKLARMMFPIGKIYDNDLGMSSGWGMAVLETGGDRVSQRYCLGFSENFGHLFAKVRLPKVERVLERINSLVSFSDIALPEMNFTEFGKSLKLFLSIS